MTAAVFRLNAQPRPCAVCGSPFLPRSAKNFVCRTSATCESTAAKIRWCRGALDPDRAAKYGMTVDSVRARLNEMLARVHDRGAFERDEPSQRRPRKTALDDAPVIGLAEDGSPIHATEGGEEVLGKPCQACGASFTGPGKVCADVECNRRRRVAAARARRAAQKPASTAEAPNPWSAAPPRWDGALPGAVLPIDASPPLVSSDRLGPALHAVLTRLLRHGRGHDPTRPEWSLQLVGAATSSKWAVYLPAEADVAVLRGKSFASVVADQSCALTFGARACVRLKAPTVTQTARHRVCLTTITPVTIRSMGKANKCASFPSSVQLWTALTNVATRIGLTLPDPTAIGVVRVSHDTEPVTCLLNAVKGSTAHGWAGGVVLDVNPLARWLLDVAARIGLGGRTAFGLGRIAVRDVVVESSAPLPVPEPWEIVVDGAAEKMAARMRTSLDEARTMLKALAEQAVFEETCANGTETWRAGDVLLIVQPTTLRTLRIVDVVFEAGSESGTNVIDELWRNHAA